MSDTSSEDERVLMVEPVADNDDEDEDDVADVDEDEDEDDGDSGVQNTVDAWRQVHAHLVKAVNIAREAVAAKKLQRRFWLEELTANVSLHVNCVGDFFSQR